MEPHNEKQINKPEMVRRRAARYTNRRYRNTSSVSDMFDSLVIPKNKDPSYNAVQNHQQLSRHTSEPISNIRQQQDQISSPHKYQPIPYQNRHIEAQLLPQDNPSLEVTASVAEAPDLVSFKVQAGAYRTLFLMDY
jgi:hypothetical protein